MTLKKLDHEPHNRTCTACGWYGCVICEAEKQKLSEITHCPNCGHKFGDYSRAFESIDRKFDKTFGSWDP